MDDARQPQAQALKQQLADALLMLERAEVIDFNGHMSCRLPGTPHVLINSGKSVRSALTAAEVETIGANLRKPHLLRKVWDYHRAKLR